MPPVGQNKTSGNGAPSACNMARPPACSAGNSLSTLKPAARAVINSVGVMTPGSRGNRAPREAAASSGVRPGVTPNCAPARSAAAKSTARVSVPTPTMAAGTTLRIASMAASATGVRMVISNTRKPPATKARASGTAVSRSVTVRTGMTGAMPTISRIFTNDPRAVSQQRQRAGLRIAGGAAHARKQFAAAPILVVRVIEPRRLSLPPDALGNFRLQHPGVTVQTYHIAVPYFSQGAAVQNFRRDMNGGGHASRAPRHPAVGHQRDVDSLALQGSERRRQLVKLRHAVGAWSLKTDDGHEIP